MVQRCLLISSGSCSLAVLRGTEVMSKILMPEPLSKEKGDKGSGLRFGSEFVSQALGASAAQT